MGEVLEFEAEGDSGDILQNGKKTKRNPKLPQGHVASY